MFQNRTAHTEVRLAPYANNLLGVVKMHSYTCRERLPACICALICSSCSYLHRKCTSVTRLQHAHVRHLQRLQKRHSSHYEA